MIAISIETTYVDADNILRHKETGERVDRTSTVIDSRLTGDQRQHILRAEYRKALANITPNMPGRYSGQQIAAAKGIARKRALAIIDQHDAAQRLNGRDFARAMKAQDAAR